jgi:hypothetical protein
MIQIGEAGWLLPVGGMVLGKLQPDSGEFCYRVLSVELFQGERYQDRQYVQEAYNLTAEILSGLNVPKHTEPLQICAGNVTHTTGSGLTRKATSITAAQPPKNFRSYSIRLYSNTCARMLISIMWNSKRCTRNRRWTTGCAGNG